jgi:hypothetical protein
MLHTTEYYKTINISDLITKLGESANKTISYLEKKMTINGSYGNEIKDISSYFKSPMLFISANRFDLAEKSISYIYNKFKLENGDFATSDVQKSTKEEYLEYWSYMNGWIIRAANHLNKIDPDSLDYFKNYFCGKNKGFLTHETKKNDGVTDVLTAAHHGLIHLEMQNEEMALSAGNYLCDAIEKQPDIQNKFYLRFNSNGSLITDDKRELELFCKIEKREPNQLHFMMGYPSAFLAILYARTNKECYIKSAKCYLDFSLGCDKSVYTCNFSHKLAWASSLIYKTIKEEKYLRAIKKISEYFISLQDTNGLWYPEADTNTQFDQSAEIACWFLNIRDNLLNVTNKNFHEYQSCQDSKQTLNTKLKLK